MSASRSLKILSALAAVAAVSARAALISYSDLASFTGANTTVVVEDFESAAIPHDVAMSSFTHNGITFTGDAGVRTHNVWDASAGYVNFSVPITTSSVLTANGDENILMTFSSPSTAVGFDTYLNFYGPATITVTLVGGGSQVYTFNQDPTKVGFWGVSSDDAAIASVRWATVNGGLINTGIDNIRAGAPSGAVPEPSTLALVTLGGCAALVAMRRRAR